MILVTGAGGNVGSEVAARLVALGKPVRAVVHRGTTGLPSSYRHVNGEVLPADLTEPDDVRAMLAGIDHVYLQAHGDVGLFAAEAADAGVRHIVLHSSLTVLDPDSALGRHHLAAERALAGYPGQVTIIRTSPHASNALAWAPSVRTVGAVYAPYPAAKTAPVHPGDVADVVAHALMPVPRDGDRDTITLTGPETLTLPEQVASLARTVGQQITYTEISPDNACAQMTGAGVPGHLIDGLLYEMRVAATREPVVQPLNIPRHVPRTWADWCTENRAVFGGAR